MYIRSLQAAEKNGQKGWSDFADRSSEPYGDLRVVRLENLADRRSDEQFGDQLKIWLTISSKIWLKVALFLFEHEILSLALRNFEFLVWFGLYQSTITSSQANQNPRMRTSRPLLQR